MLPFPYRPSPPLGPGKRPPRQRILSQWRGIDIAPLEKAKALRTRPISGVLPAVLKDLRMDRRRAEAEVVKVWNHLLDGKIVRYRRKEILERLHHSFGREFIARISFRVG